MVCASHLETIRCIFAASSEELQLGAGNAIFLPIFSERATQSVKFCKKCI
jgi:hypothetical protein